MVLILTRERLGAPLIFAAPGSLTYNPSSQAKAIKFSLIKQKLFTDKKSDNSRNGFNARS